jgi:hypothetical protein
VKTVIHKINNFVVKPKPLNADLPFDAHNTRVDAVTVTQFATIFNDFVSTHGLTTSAVNDLLTILRDTTHSLSLPLLEKDQINTTTQNNNVKIQQQATGGERKICSNTLCDYLCDDSRSITTDVCRHECMAFRGFSTDKTTGCVIDHSTLIRCLECKNPRFSKCSHVTCRKNKRSYDSCDPFVLKKFMKPCNDGTGRSFVVNRGHSLAQRVAMKRVYYRSIIGKLIQMYCLSLIDGYDDILNYENIRIKKRGKIIDILDGKNIKLQRKNMKDNFNNVKKNWKKKYADLEDLYECSIILTMCYDGVTNFKRKADSMWPLLCSIANCNPSHRGKIGTGMFLVMLHNASMGSGVESYMMKDMLTEELKKLEEGLFFTIPQQNGFAERHVFLQARLVYAHLDTKALEKVACIKLSNSLVGCTLCNLQRGVYRHCVHKCVYIGTRLPLHKYHKLRRCGQRVFKKDKLRKKLSDGKTIEEARISAEEYERLYYKGDASSTDQIKKENSEVKLNETAKILPDNFSNPLR